jgi:bifunctional non-homologous end joining protein LigD
MTPAAAQLPGGPEVAGIRISHPDRILYPERGLTKLDVARYYAGVGARMLPHVKGRPLTLVHCPEGLRAPCRYMRHTKVWGPAVLRRVRIREKTKTGEYLVADSVEAVVALAQMGVLEIHTWNARAEAVEYPDRIVWDLDPGPEVSWAQTVKGARLLRSVLEALRLQSWVKTTGGHGLHVVVPLAPVRQWSECLAFARGVAEAVARSAPDDYTTAFAKAGREHKILLDYLRNNRTNTSVAAFSTRARPGAPVSAPLDWKSLGARRTTPDVTSVLRRARRPGPDPWSDYWSTAQRIADDALAAVRRL